MSNEDLYRQIINDKIEIIETQKILIENLQRRLKSGVKRPMHFNIFDKAEEPEPEPVDTYVPRPVPKIEYVRREEVAPPKQTNLIDSLSRLSDAQLIALFQMTPDNQKVLQRELFLKHLSPSGRERFMKECK